MSSKFGKRINNQDTSAIDVGQVNLTSKKTSETRSTEEKTTSIPVLLIRPHLPVRHYQIRFRDILIPDDPPAQTMEST